MTRRGDLMRSRPAGGGQQGAVGGHQRDVGLAVPAVDGQHGGGPRRRRSRARSGRQAQGRNRWFSAIAGRPRSASVVLADQRMREQRGGHPVPPAAQRRVHGELLVGGHVRDQSAQQRRQRRGQAGAGPPAPIVAGTSITASSARKANVPSLRTFTTWRPRCRRAATTAAPPPPPSRTPRPAREQFRLLVQRRVGVHPEQFGLDRRDFRRPRGRLPLLGDDRVVHVEIAQVIRRHKRQIQPERRVAADPRRDLLPVAGDELGQPVGPVDQDRPFPGQVVQPHVVERHACGRHAEQRRRTSAGSRSPRCTARRRGARRRAAPG